MTGRTFLATAAAARTLLCHRAVAEQWGRPSHLEGYRVGGLAAHLARAVLTVPAYLDATPPQANGAEVEVTDAAGYFVAVLGDDDPVDGALHRGVRARAEDLADGGPDALVTQVADAVAGLRARLPQEDPDRPIAVRDGIVLPLADYLRTRLVELVVHADDLAVSVGLDRPPEIPDAAHEAVARDLASLAVRRHGGLAVVRSLARRERQREAVRAF